MGRAHCACVLALAACGAKTATPGGSGPKTAAKLCIDPKAPGGTSIELVRQDDPSLLESPQDLDGGRVALAQAENVQITENADCGQTPCSPEIVAGAAHVALPHGENIQPSDVPFTVDWVSVADVDGDGAPEAWVSYGIASPPEPGVGSTTTEYVAMFSLPDLTLRFAAQSGSYPEASTLDHCDGQLALVDADCNRKADFVLTQVCVPAVCREDPDEEPDLCGNPTPPTAAVYLQGGDGTYAALDLSPGP